MGFVARLGQCFGHEAEGTDTAQALREKKKRKKKGPGIEPQQCSPHHGLLAEVRPQRFEKSVNILLTQVQAGFQDREALWPSGPRNDLQLLEFRVPGSILAPPAAQSCSLAVKTGLRV